MRSLPQFLAQARQRASRRRSRWNLVLFAIQWPLAALWCTLLVRGVFWLPWHGGLTFQQAARHNGPMLLIVLPLLALSFILAMLSANLLLFLIPPARRALAAEAGDTPKLQFGGSQKALLKAAAM